jgi:hypothetical protein
MESKKINQLATELTPVLSDLTIIGDPSTGISKKITLSQMASLFTGTVEEYPNLASFPLVGTADTIYIALDTNVLYRWNTSTNAYVELSPNIVTSLVFNDANGFDGTINLVGSVATLTITTALTTGSVGFIGASGALLQDNANFFWDDTNNRLGLGTNAPTTALDAFGSGIIGRLNGTSTNNAYLGFASAGTNKWSIGNVQSDHRFRIYNDATTSELVSVLSTGEFGIGIANPTTKLHIDGGANALIANLDANVSIAKSISFRSDNSARMNIEVSGSENGSNTGANFQIKRFSDAGSLINTPFEIIRENGYCFFSSPYLGLAENRNGAVSIEIQNFTAGTAATASYNIRTDGGGASFGKYSSLVPANGIINGNDVYLFSGILGSIAIATSDPNGTIKMAAGNSATAHLTIASTGAATFSNSITQSGYLDILGGSLSSTNGLHQWFNTSTNQAWIQAFQSGVDWRQINYNGAVHNFLINDVSTLYVNNSRNVGIGTTDPQYKTQITSTSANTVTNCLGIHNGSNPAGGGTGARLLFKLSNFESAAETRKYASIEGLSTADYNETIALVFKTQAAASSNDVAERMRINGNGNVNIGSSGSATYRLVVSNTTAYGIAIENLSIGGGSSTGDIGLYFGDSGSGVLTLTREKVSNNTALTALYSEQGYNTQQVGLYIYAGAAYQGNNSATWSITSDIRIKENIRPISDSLNKILALSPCHFEYKNKLGKVKTGFIAQEFEKILPGHVHETAPNKEYAEFLEEGEMIKSIDTDLIPYLVKAIQEQQAQIEELKQLIKNK